jgi:tRNA (guanine-N7-)-methyltransferase
VATSKVLFLVFMGNSKVVTSNQAGLHQKLDEVINKHIHSDYKKPYQQHNLVAFAELKDWLNLQSVNSLILDSCCGTGMSSMQLAEMNPSSLVIGIDQSFKRLNKQLEGIVKPDNCLLLQANCEDIWRLCIDDNIQFDSHYILYPNPWPKSVHLIRRWHGHPVFPYLKKLTGKTILRSNWRLYLEEFNRAWFLLTKKQSVLSALEVQQPLTLFEKKYFESGQALFELIVKS